MSNKLSDEEWEIVNLRLQGFTYAYIAEKLGISRKQALEAVHRIVQILRGA